MTRLVFYLMNDPDKVYAVCENLDGEYPQEHVDLINGDNSDLNSWVLIYSSTDTSIYSGVVTDKVYILFRV